MAHTQTTLGTEKQAVQMPIGGQNIFEEYIENKQKVTVYIQWLGQQIPVTGVIKKYSKPFVKLQVGNITRIFNENSIREIAPRP